jgi:ATP-dependent RNA helicase RhlE
VLGIAQTGTGKTAAFVLPLLHALALEKAELKQSDLNDKRVHKAYVPRKPKTAKALILVPTRELAQQISVAVKTYGRNLKPVVAVIVGGASASVQAKAMADGVDILVATPGRLEDHMRTGAVRLSDTDLVVLDEADQMLDMGFIPAMRRIWLPLPAPARRCCSRRPCPNRWRLGEGLFRRTQRRSPSRRNPNPSTALRNRCCTFQRRKARQAA